MKFYILKQSKELNSQSKQKKVFFLIGLRKHGI